MRRLIESLAIVACLAACSKGGETITDVDDGPFGGVYTLRAFNEAPLPLYFAPWWYPGRGGAANILFTTVMSGNLTVRPDGSYTWTTVLEEVSPKPNASLPEFVVSTVRREANGTWTYTATTGAVTLEGIDQLGAYVLTGSATSTGLTLSSTFTSRANSTFVLER